MDTPTIDDSGTLDFSPVNTTETSDLHSLYEFSNCLDLARLV